MSETDLSITKNYFTDKPVLFDREQMPLIMLAFPREIEHYENFSETDSKTIADLLKDEIKRLKFPSSSISYQLRRSEKMEILLFQLDGAPACEWRLIYVAGLTPSVRRLASPAEMLEQGTKLFKEKKMSKALREAGTSARWFGGFMAGIIAMAAALWQGSQKGLMSPADSSILPWFGAALVLGVICWLLSLLRNRRAIYARFT
jgi:hypothetical protein